MAFILTFLGKGGTGRSTLAIASAKKFATEGKRVLLATQDPSLSFLLGNSLSIDPQEIAPNIQGVYLQSTVLLEHIWEELKHLESQYVRTPFFKHVFGQELGILPGMDQALALNAIREYDKKGHYDVIIYDGLSGVETLRMLGMPEILSWYLRRFREILVNSDLAKVVSPFIQPITSAVLTLESSADNLGQPTKDFGSLLEQAKEAITNPHRVAAYLVTNGDEVGNKTARYLWGSSQQVGLTVGGLIVNKSPLTDSLKTDFTPLSLVSIPERIEEKWEPLIAALPEFTEALKSPQPITINVESRQVSLFLPGFDKKQIKLIQLGPEVTIEAGDQRRNIFLPPKLRGLAATGAKFQNNYLIISF